MDDMTLREMRRKAREHRKELREKWKAEGLCSKCGKRPPANGFKQCGVCLEKARRSWRESKLLDEGLSPTSPPSQPPQTPTKPPKPPKQDTEDKWLVSAASCKGCKWYGYLGGNKSTRMCNYTLLMHKIRHNPPSRCEVKELGRLMIKPPARPLPKAVKPR